MKRLTALLLVVLSVFIFCSCGSEKPQEKDKQKKPSTSTSDKKNTSGNNSKGQSSEQSQSSGADDTGSSKPSDDKEDTVVVTIDYQNGLKSEIHNLKKGSLVPKPTVLNPTKEKANFIGWGTRTEGKYLKDLWNFDTDKVTADTKIYANYSVKSDFYLPKENASQLKNGGNTRIMSFNVLAGEWASCTNKEPATRLKYFKNTLNRYLPDVLGVQEFNAEWYAAVKNNYSTYKAVNESEPRIGSQYNYSTVLYNVNKVDLLEFGQVKYQNQDNEKTAKITWGYFNSKSTGNRFVVVSTHWSLKNSMSIKQTVELWAKIKELQDKYKVPVICTGDYNSNDADYITLDGEKSTLAKFYEDSNYIEAKYNAKSVGLICQTLHKGDGVSHTKGELGIKSFIDVKINQVNCVDHIMSPSNVIPTYYDTVVDSDSLEASDHCPIYADFIL